MLRTVVLRHELPDGSHHFDWLVEPSPPGPSPDPDERSLLAWRLAAPLHEAGTAVLHATRLPPHRRLYLEYEGTLSGGRGRVERLAEGWAERLEDGPESMTAIIAFDGRRLEIVGERKSLCEWNLRVVTRESPRED